MDDVIKNEPSSQGKNTINTLTEDLRHVSVVGKPRQFLHGEFFFSILRKVHRICQYKRIKEKLYNLWQQQHESIDDFTYKLSNIAQNFAL